MSVLARLRGMSRHELAFRASSLARMHADRLSTRVVRPRWRREHLAAALAPAAASADVRHAIEHRQWMDVHRMLASRVDRRPPRFILDPVAAPAIRESILERWPGAAREAAARADLILAGRFNLLAYEDLSFDSGETPLDWHFDPVHGARAPRVCWAEVPYLDPACGDHKVIWELNRHQHWLALTRASWLTGEPRYRLGVLDQLSSWLAANPPLLGINWASMLELGLRSIAWTWALHALRADDDSATEPWLVDILLGLHRQLSHVEQHLSHYFSPNTHLTGEALALYVVGLALPDLAHADRWAAKGREILLAELDRQVSLDGGHVERSTHYHRYTLDFYLLALLVATRNGDTAALPRFRDGVARAAAFLHAMADDNGRTPLIGDDDGGMLWPMTGRQPNDVRDSLSLASVVLEDRSLAPWGLQEEAVWLASSTHLGQMQRLAAAPVASGSAHTQPGIETRVFADTGYVVVREGARSHLVFDVGPHGYLNGGHAHADSLAVTLGVNGHPLLVDPGTAVYTADPALRDRMRSSILHNTLTLDGVGASVPDGPFHWRSRTDARLDASRANAGFAWAEGAHNGYADAIHRRTLVRARGAGTLIVDQIGGRERHTAQLHWHFGPEWDVGCDSARRLRARHDDGTQAWLVRDSGSLWLTHGDAETGLGWCSPCYGAVVPTCAARVTRTARAPFDIVTWIGTGQGTPSLERVRPETDPSCNAVAVRVVQDDTAHVTLVRPGEPAVREERSCAVADYQTNARLLHYAMRGNALAAVAIADATHALSLSEGLLSLAADGHIDDLHLSISADVVELIASRPLTRLHLQGAALTHVVLVTLNGRELHLPGGGRGDGVVIPASAWAAPTERMESVELVEPVERVERPGPRLGNREHGTVVCVE